MKASLAFFSFAELPENWTDTRETLLEGMVFQLKYLGVTMVEQPKGEELSAAAVKRIVATVRDGDNRCGFFIHHVQMFIHCTFLSPPLPSRPRPAGKNSRKSL